MGALPRVCQPLDSGDRFAKTVTASAFGWNGDGFTEQCPWPKELVSCDPVGKVRLCDHGRTCMSKSARGVAN